ncbi:hypothetical protein HMPREF9248_0872 [Fannyhessea vaginae PB189-T1-4]|uniref:Uncharacterized protein n=1 Tax=Fannyhessea vaginae PB189-T1-4 TaxID=866774 RepID=A0ABP2IYR6_9ACTN|nr:hypothetical protein HMPREF9248_0872 [Fannyhessea vaginae PB189-T1-4]
MLRATVAQISYASFIAQKAGKTRAFVQHEDSHEQSSPLAAATYWYYPLITTNKHNKAHELPCPTIISCAYAFTSL